jgi:hypothetical protein
MQQFPNSPIRFQLGLRGWLSVVVGLAMLVALTALVSLLAFGIFLIAVPVFVLTPLFLHFRRSKAPNIIVPPSRDGDPIAKGAATIIDGTLTAKD